MKKQKPGSEMKENRIDAHNILLTKVAKPEFVRVPTVVAPVMTAPHIKKAPDFFKKHSVQTWKQDHPAVKILKDNGCIIAEAVVAKSKIDMPLAIQPTLQVGINPRERLVSEFTSGKMFEPARLLPVLSLLSVANILPAMQNDPFKKKPGNKLPGA